MLRRFVLTLGVFVMLPALASADQSACPVQLQEAQTHAAVLTQSRDVTEQQFAKALRANKELSGLYDKALAHITALEKELAELKAKEKP